MTADAPVGPHPRVPTWTFGFAVDRDVRDQDARRHGTWSVPPTPEIVRGALVDLAAKAERDDALSVASRRWLPGRRDPDGYVPGDVPAVRSMIAHAAMTAIAGGSEGFRYWPPDVLAGAAMEVALIETLYRAEPHWVPTRLAHAVATSTAPGEDDLSRIRLGYPANLVMFGDDIPIDPSVWRKPPYVGSDISDVPDHPLGPVAMLPRIARRGGGICGLVLLADDEGRMRDDFLLLFCAFEDPMSSVPLDRLRSAQWGWRSRCTPGTQNVLDNVAAYLAWGDWRTPEPLDLPDHKSKDWRHVTRTSRFKKAELRGDATGVRVAAFKPSSAGAGSHAEPEGTHRSPVPHHRRGHWRDQAIGPREEKRREPRWIAPTWVNPGGGEPPVRVWSIGAD